MRHQNAGVEYSGVENAGVDRDQLVTATLRETPPQKRSGMARVLNGSQFYLHTHTFIRNWSEPYLAIMSLPSYSCYSFTDLGEMED